MAQYIDIIKQAGGELLSCASPARYTGGETGRLAKKEAFLQTIIAFPDLYEIGMSNNALKILYNRLNALDDISCDRVFAPAPDFEELLAKKNIPLYALDTGLAVHDAALLMFTISYELSATNLLLILESSHIELYAKNRSESDPIVIAGGPCVSNPLPYAPFIDAFWIGEAEDSFFHLAEQLRDAKKNGASRAALLAQIHAHPAVWTSGKTNVRRAIDHGFADRTTAAAIYPLPSMRIVQQHAAVEIMRGCPNGCRFCHAGIWYRPARQKPVQTIVNEVSDYVQKGGFREISLSSLSTGDYTGIGGLVDLLNQQFAASRVSFQLPSLHISTFSLALLDKVALVRKSSLTFAIETPDDICQLALNKEITLDMVTQILELAKKSGYKTAKFYFMLGLPVSSGGENESSEEDKIIDFINQAARKVRMHFTISAGIFIPKPHTPFQWAAQMPVDAGSEKLYKLRQELKKGGHKVKTHDPFTSLLEGILSRGDERCAELVMEAYKAGCRLDSWSDYFKRDIWQALVAKYSTLAAETSGARETSSPLPWDIIESGVSKTYLEQEWKRSQSRKLTKPCSPNCSTCGICPKPHGGERPPHSSPSLCAASAPFGSSATPPIRGCAPKTPQTSHRMLFSYTKEDSAVYLSHLALIEVFSSALLRAAIPIQWTEGFNPMPKLEFAAPLAVGIASSEEIALTDISEYYDGGEFLRQLNPQLPEGIHITRAQPFTVPAGVKKHAVPALLWGFAYENNCGTDIVQAAADKNYRTTRCPATWAGLKRSAIFAKTPSNTPSTYFEVYQQLYGSMMPDERYRT